MDFWVEVDPMIVIKIVKRIVVKNEVALEDG